jgi:predicted Zn-dependent protease
LAVAQARLLAEHQYGAEAEQTYRIAIDMCPYNPEAVFSYAGMLTGQKRWQDALSVAQAAVNADPGNAQFQALVTQLKQAQKALHPH